MRSNVIVHMNLPFIHSSVMFYFIFPQQFLESCVPMFAAAQMPQSSNPGEQKVLCIV